MKTIKTEDPELAVTAVSVDTGGGEHVLGFAIHAEAQRGAAVEFVIGLPTLNELIEMVTYEGCKVGRDFQYELWGAVSQGEDRARREKK